MPAVESPVIPLPGTEGYFFMVGWKNGEAASFFWLPLQFASRNEGFISINSVGDCKPTLVGTAGDLGQEAVESFT